MTPVAIGRRNRLVTLEAPTTVTESSGYPVETFAPLATSPTEFVSIEPMRGAEAVRAQQQFGQTGAVLRMRYRSDLSARARAVESNGTVWNFLSPPVDPDGRRHTLEVMVGHSG